MTAQTSKHDEKQGKVTYTVSSIGPLGFKRSKPDRLRKAQSGMPHLNTHCVCRISFTFFTFYFTLLLLRDHASHYVPIFSFHKKNTAPLITQYFRALGINKKDLEKQF